MAALRVAFTPDLQRLGAGHLPEPVDCIDQSDHGPCGAVGLDLLYRLDSVHAAVVGVIATD